LVWKRPQQHEINHTKDCCAGAYSKREGRNRDRAKSRLFQQHTQTKEQVPNNRFHWRPGYGKNVGPIGVSAIGILTYISAALRSLTASGLFFATEFARGPAYLALFGSAWM